MKTLTLILLSLFTAAVHAQPVTPPAGGGSRAPARDTSELAALEVFLNLGDEELAQMAAAIARVRAMTPAQRDQLRQEVAAFRHLPEPQRERLRHGWGSMPPEIQAGWRDMMQHATAEERAAIQAQMQTLSPDGKAEYRRKLVEDYLKKRATK